MRVPRVFIDQKVVSGEAIFLSTDKTHHILHVLRLQAGDQIQLFNNSGFEFKAKIIEAKKKAIQVEVGESSECENESPLEIALYLAVSRGPHMDFSIQKAVELGVKVIIPIISEFSNVKLMGHRVDNKMAHWKKIIIGAAEQCGRNTLAELQSPVTFNESINLHNDSKRLILHPNVGQTMSDININNNKLALMIGPEGGFNEAEFQKALDNNYIPVNLGPRILRTETAVVCSLSNAQQLWGDLN